MRDYLYMFIAAMCLGTIGFFVKLDGGSVHPMVMGFYRLFFGFITLLVICPLADHTTFHLKKKDIPIYALIGLLFAVSLTLTNIAYVYAPIQNITLLDRINPFFVLIFAFFILKEKITKTKVIALCIALTGILIMNPFHNKGGIGNLIIVIAVIIQALLVILMRKVDIDHTVGDVMWFLLFASLFLLPFPLVYGFGSLSLPLLLLGVVSTGIAYFFFNLALEHIEAETAAIIETAGAPLVAILLAVFFLKESLSLQVIIGGLLLICAVVYLQTHVRKTSKS